MIKEWVASLLVVLGVALMVYGHGALLAVWLGGIATLTLGVRLAIECGKAKR